MEKSNKKKKFNEFLTMIGRYISEDIDWTESIKAVKAMNLTIRKN